MSAMENELKALRLRTGLPAKSFVDTVKTIYPKYDKTVQSKAENTKDYGVMLAPDAMRLLKETFEPTPPQKPAERRKSGEHRLKCRVTCRLEDGVYQQLQHAMNASGYHTMQDFLTALLTEHLGKEGASDAG